MTHRLIYLAPVLLLLGQYASCQNNTSDVSEETLANLTAGNDLWSALLKNCKEPTISCLKTNIYEFLKDTLDYPADIQFTNFLKFARNSLNYSTNTQHADENDIEDANEEYALEEITRSLHDNTVKFFMTHDVELQLPDTFFHGSTIKISPRSVDDSGAIVKLEVLPKLSTEVGEGRLFFKKIKKFISERLVYALLAVLLVIKLLAAKFLFILPMILGAATAKKILIKVLLFIFPALHHLFKLCAYYPTQTKYHHHKHLISHIHSVAHKIPPSIHSHHGPHHHSGGVEVIAPHSSGPPSLHHGGHFDDHDLHHEHHDYYDPNDNELGISFYPGSPGIGNDIISHRHDPHEDKPWGQGQKSKRKKIVHQRPPSLSSAELENAVLKAEKEAFIKARLQKERERIQEENLKLQEQLNHALKLQEKLKLQQAIFTNKLPSVGLTAPNININKKVISPPSLYLQSPPARPVPTVQEQISFGQIGQIGQIGPVSPVAQESQVKPAVSIPKAPVGNLGTLGAVGPVAPSVVVGSVSPVSPPKSGSKPHVSNSLLKVPSGVSLPQASEVFNAYQKLHHDNVKDKNDSLEKVPIPQKTSEKVKSSAKVQPTFSGSVEIVKPVEPQLPKAEKKIYQAASITYDVFYSPILEKIDKILEEVGFIEEPCKERLICSMYKNPTKFSPHSNLVSAELSRDPEELQKPKTTNAAVIRFYKYVQAARDGQDGRDCIRLYPACIVNTEE